MKHQPAARPAAMPASGKPHDLSDVIERIRQSTRPAPMSNLSSTRWRWPAADPKLLLDEA